MTFTVAYRYSSYQMCYTVSAKYNKNISYQICLISISVCTLANVATLSNDNIRFTELLPVCISEMHHHA